MVQVCPVTRGGRAEDLDASLHGVAQRRKLLLQQQGLDTERVTADTNIK